MKLVKLLFAATIGVLATADMKISPVCIGATACAGTGVIFLGVWAAQETFDENHKNSGTVSKTTVPDSNVPSLLFGDSQVEEPPDCPPIVIQVGQMPIKDIGAANLKARRARSVC